MSLYKAAAQEQAERKFEDPWLPLIAGAVGDSLGKLRTEDVWQILQIKPEHRSQNSSERIGAVMLELGFKRTKLRFGGPNPEGCFVRGNKAQQAKRI